MSDDLKFWVILAIIISSITLLLYLTAGGISNEHIIANYKK